MFTVHIQTIRLLQLLYTDPSTVSHTLTNLWQFDCMLDIIKRFNIGILKLCTPHDGPVRPKTYRSWHIITFLWFCWIVCVCWFTLW